MKENKLIAEFMGYPKIANDEDKRDYLEDCVKYHDSWDWLMPVITHCKNINPEWVNENGQHLIDNIDDAISCCYGIDDTYEAVIEFIKQYNNERNRSN